MLLSRSRWIKLAPYLFISPFFVHLIVFQLYPVLYGFWLSLYQGVSKLTFAGLKNYNLVLHDEVFWKSMGNGLKATAGSVFIILPIALAVALLINQPFVEKRKGWFATFFFTPNITSAVAVSIIFGLIFNKSFGIVNIILGYAGVNPIGWLENPRWTLPALIILLTWRYLGINILYFLAGLQNIPQELNEAAKIDGANALQRFYYVTLPLLRPILTFIIFQAVIGSFSMFAEPFVLAGPGQSGPENSLLFPTMYIYQQAFRLQNFGYSSSVGYVFTIILLIIGIIQIKLFQEKQ